MQKTHSTLLLKCVQPTPPHPLSQTHELTRKNNDSPLHMNSLDKQAITEDIYSIRLFPYGGRFDIRST